MSDEFDAPWKVALELFLGPFLALCFPAVHALIDWRIAPVFLDAELQQIAPEHAQGARNADRLVKVRLLDGREEWLFIHIEVQARRESDFARRMWTYYYRFWDKYGQSVVSLAVLADDDAHWHPRFFERELAGCRLLFEFPTFKVAGFPDAEGVFDRTINPFALLIAAHQLALRSRRDPAARYDGRFRLLRHPRQRALAPAKVWNLLRLIAWLNRLPREMELRFRQEWNKLPGSERIMTIDEFKSPFEVAVMIETQQRAILDALEARFGAVSEEARARVQKIVDDVPLRQAHRLAVTAGTLQKFLAGI